MKTSILNAVVLVSAVKPLVAGVSAVTMILSLPMSAKAEATGMLESECKKTAKFIGEIWPLLASTDDKLVDERLAAPIDPLKAQKDLRQRKTKSVKINQGSEIWTANWTGNIKPDKILVRKWLTVQNRSAVRCIKAIRGLQDRVITKFEAANFLRDWSNDKKEVVFWVGQPAFNPEGTRSLLHISSASPGLGGEGSLRLFQKTEDGWKELSRTVYAVS